MDSSPDQGPFKGALYKGAVVSLGRKKGHVTYPRPQDAIPAVNPFFWAPLRERALESPCVQSPDSENTCSNSKPDVPFKVLVLQPHMSTQATTTYSTATLKSSGALHGLRGPLFTGLQPLRSGFGILQIPVPGKP